MTGRPAWWRHLLVALVVVAATGAAYTGLVGRAPRPERVDGYEVIVRPTGADGLRIDEVIDQDFGFKHKHGPERVIPRDFGTPTDVRASSSDAPDDVAVAHVDGDLRIRVGDPDQTVTGQHRYRVAYTLPEARISSGRLDLDAIGAESDIPIDDVDVYLTGMTLADATCSSGGVGADGGCTVTEAGSSYHVHVDHLDQREGVTVSGTITPTTGDVGDPPIHPLPTRHHDDPVRRALFALVLGLVTAVAVERFAVRRGSNQVSGAGAADAAFGAGAPALGAMPVRMVSDAELATMSTVEFSPPPGIEPWQGTVLLRERLDTIAIVAWFSGAAVKGWIEIVEEDGTTELRPGPKRAEVTGPIESVLTTLFQLSDQVLLGRYRLSFGLACKELARQQRAWIDRAGWWRRPIRKVRDGSRTGASGLLEWAWVLPLLIVGGAAAGVGLATFGAVGGIVGLVLLAVGGPLAVGLVLYAPLLPGRTATGSAAALRTESFRRFLVESEGEHVEWAWKHGVLREYSAWAVALGAADAWRQAMAQSTVVPPQELDWSTPFLAASMITMFHTTSNQPPSTGGGGDGDGGSSGFSGGGGGFGGFSGSVGGGGGGGSIGSW